MTHHCVISNDSAYTPGTKSYRQEQSKINPHSEKRVNLSTTVNFVCVIFH